nr:MAG TPA: hypothetical protein [Caudoviricetes sp.]
MKNPRFFSIFAEQSRMLGNLQIPSYHFLKSRSL